MPLETGSFISDLNPLNPLEGDQARDGDNHLRLIKATLKSTFPNVTGAVTPTHTELNKLAGVTATTAELNKLAGLTPTTAQINFLLGVTSLIQTQLDALVAKDIVNAPEIGVILPFGGTVAPAYNLLCQGQAVNRVGIYANLFNVIGVKFGAGDGSTTFNIPDMRGLTVRGLDGGRGYGGQTNVGDVQLDSLKDHTHSGSTTGNGDHNHSAPSGGNFIIGSAGGATGFGAGGAYSPTYATATTTNSGNHSHTFTTGSPSTGAATETRVKSMGVNFIIRY